MALGIAVAVRNTRMDAIKDAVDAGAGAGVIKIYDATRPSTGGTPTTLLAELTFTDPSFPAASSGAITASAITGDTSADNTGTATWFRLETSVGGFVLDGDVGVTSSGADLELNSVSITAGVAVDITSMVLTDGNAWGVKNGTFSRA